MGAEGGFAARGAAPAGGREHDLAPALAWIRSRLRHLAGDADAGDAGGGPPAALENMARQLGLSGFEREVVLLCVALELDTGVASLCARAHGDAGRPFPTFALALTMFEHPTWDALAPDGPLRAWRLIEVHQRSEEPLLTSPLRIDERILHHAKGLACVDERLGPLLAPMPGGDVAEATGSPAVREVADALRRADAGRAGAFVYLLGSDPEAGRELAEGAAAASGLLLRRLSARVLEAPDAEADALARLLRRECLLAPLALYLDARELEPAAARRLSEFLGRLAGPGGGPLFVALEEVPPTRPGRARAGRRAAGPGGAAGGLGRGAGPRRRRPAGPARGPVPPGPVGHPPDRPRGAVRRPVRPPGVRGAALGRLPARDPAQARGAGRPPGAARDLGRSCPAAGGAGPAPAGRGPGAPALDGVRRLGLPAQAQPRARAERPVRRRERHGQDSGRGGAGVRVAARPLPDRPVGGREQVRR